MDRLIFALAIALALAIHSAFACTPEKSSDSSVVAETVESTLAPFDPAEHGYQAWRACEDVIEEEHGDVDMPGFRDDYVIVIGDSAVSVNGIASGASSDLNFSCNLKYDGSGWQIMYLSIL